MGKRKKWKAEDNIASFTKDYEEAAALGVWKVERKFADETRVNVWAAKQAPRAQILNVTYGRCSTNLGPPCSVSSTKLVVGLGLQKT